MSVLSHIRRGLRAWRSERGAVAAEFALVLPTFLLLTLGTIGLCTVMYAMSTLHYAVEDAARCVSVKTTVCTDQTSMATYAAAHYKGPNVAITYTLIAATAGSCGNKVTGVGTYSLKTGLTTLSVPLSATACYPANS